MPNGVWLIRHGKTKWNSENASEDFVRGWVDVPLDEEGKKDAKEIVAYVRTLKPSSIYSSDLQRAKDIAQAAAKECKCPLEVSRDFRPWGLGQFQGKPAKEVVPQLQGYIDEPDKKVPGGESFNQFRKRVIGALKRVMKDQQTDDSNVIVVTHFRDMKLIQAWLSKGGAEEIDAKIFAANDFPPGSMLLLYRERGKWQMKRQMRTKVGVKQS